MIKKLNEMLSLAKVFLLEALIFLADTEKESVAARNMEQEGSSISSKSRNFIRIPRNQRPTKRLVSCWQLCDRSLAAEASSNK